MNFFINSYYNLTFEINIVLPTVIRLAGAIRYFIRKSMLRFHRYFKSSNIRKKNLTTFPDRDILEDLPFA